MGIIRTYLYFPAPLLERAKRIWNARRAFGTASGSWNRALALPGTALWAICVLFVGRTG